MKVDMWCLGVLLYSLACGYQPFRAKTLEELHALILKADFKFPDEIDLSQDFKDLVLGLIKLD
jgi:calcium/calmodulin-dependent protein kinase I